MPTSVHGERLDHHVLRGADNHGWAIEVLETTGRPIIDLTAATALLDPRDPLYFESYVIQIAGVDPHSLIEPVMISARGVPLKNVHAVTLDGRSVVVANMDLRGDDGVPIDIPATFYGFVHLDIVFVMLTARPEDAIEVIAQLR